MQNLGKNTANGRRPRLYGSQIHDSLGIPTDDVRRISFIGPDLNFSPVFGTTGVTSTDCDEY